VKEKIVVRVELQGPIKKKFEQLMRHYGTPTYTSLVRLLIDLKAEWLERGKVAEKPQE